MRTRSDCKWKKAAVTLFGFTLVALHAFVAVGWQAFVVTAAHAQESPKLETLDQYTRLQLPVLNGTSFRILGGKPGETTLLLDRVATEAFAGLDSWSDNRVQEVRVKPAGLDKAEITVRFRDAATESFAYLQGGRLILDIWKQKGAPQPVAEAGAGRAAVPKEKAGKKGGARKAAPPARALASAAPISPVHSKMKVEPLRMEHDLFQKFIIPMPELVITAKGGGFDLPPKLDLENHWKFSQGDKKSDEGKAYEFLKQLFAAKKYGLCIKSIEILLRDHPRTKNAEEIHFLEALAYKALGESTKTEFLSAKAERMLQELAVKRDESGAALPFQGAIMLYFAQEEYLKRNWLQAIQYLEPLAASGDPKRPDYPFIQMLLAESYGKVNQHRRAERLYRYLTEKFSHHQLAKEAYYRIADLLAEEKNYHRLDEEGEAALHAYPEYEKARAEVLFQVGEANFWLGRFAKAEKYFRRFVDVGSASTNASLGWVRIGEIQEILHSNLPAARESYLRAKNGYPFSKGDLVATVRMARIDLPVEKEPTFVVKTLREMLADQKVEWELKRMAELTLADYLILSGEIDSAIEVARSGMNQTDGQVNDLFKKSFEKGLFAKLEHMNKEKKFAAALALFNQEKKWLEAHGPESFRAVAETYRGLGLFASANKFMDQYQSELAKARGLASVEENPSLARAKAANSFARGAYAEVVSTLASASDAESLYMKAMANFRLGHKRDAYAEAERALAGVGGARENFKDEAVEDLFTVLQDRDMAERDFPRLEKDAATCRALREKESEAIAFAGADALWYQKRYADALKAYRAAISGFPKSQRIERARYNLGMSLVNLGKRDEAVKQLTELRDSGQSVWSESARQELELIDWEKKYSSVLRTLPPSGLGIAN